MIDSVEQTLTYQPVQRDRRLHDTDTAVQWPEGKPKHPSQDQPPPQLHPVVNYLGQMTGQTLNVIA